MSESGERHTLSMLVDQGPEALCRIVGLFCAKGFPIESLCVAAAGEPGTSRVTLVTTAGAGLLEKITKQLNKLIDVIKVSDLSKVPSVQCETALIKVQARPRQWAALMRIVHMHRCRLVDAGARHYTVEATGEEQDIETLVRLLRPLGIMEVARTGRAALSRHKEETGIVEEFRLGRRVRDSSMGHLNELRIGIQGGPRIPA